VSHSLVQREVSMSIDSSRLALQAAEAARLLGISRRTLFGLTYPRGPIRAVRLSAGPKAGVLYPLEELRRWLEAEIARQNSAGPQQRDLALCLLEKYPHLLASTAPVAPGTRHRGLFKLLHCLKGIPDFADRQIADLRLIVDIWYDWTLEEAKRRGFHVKATRDENFLDAARIWRGLRYPKGRLMTGILEQARRQQPAAAAQFGEPLRTFVAALWHLQRHVGDKPFYLASSTAAKLLDYRTGDGQLDKKRAWRVLKGLEAAGVLKCCDPGDNTRHRKAAQYQFIGEA